MGTVNRSTIVPDQPDQNPESEGTSLEGPLTIVETSTTPSPSPENDGTPVPAPGTETSGNKPEAKHTKKPLHLSGIWQRFNIYILGFAILMALAIGGTIILILHSRTSQQPNSINSQELSQSALQQLANSTVSVGNSSQILSIGSNAVFSGQVLVQKDLDVAGTIKVGGSISLPGLTVSGTSTFAQIQAATLGVSGNTSLLGQLTVGQSLSVGGTSSFSGAVNINSLTVQSLQLNGDLVIDHHVEAGGGTPSRSSGPALGSGGTATVNGSDTAGTVNINTGSSPAAGCFITITFSQKYSTTPYIVITPVGNAAAGLQYYIDSSTTTFSICSANAAPATTSFAFNYITFD